jgi:hypothetical protein
MSHDAWLKIFCSSSKLPPQTRGMLCCNLSVSCIVVATGFCNGTPKASFAKMTFSSDLSLARHKVDPIDQLALWMSVAFISVLFLSEALKHLEYDARSSRLQESREYFSKLRGFSFKRVQYSQELIEKNIRRVSVSIAHFQGLTLFVLMFAFLLHRLSSRFSSEVTIAASLSIAAFLPWLSSGP